MKFITQRKMFFATVLADAFIRWLGTVAAYVVGLHLSGSVIFATIFALGLMLISTGEFL